MLMSRKNHNHHNHHTPPGAGRRVVAEGLSTQRSDLLGDCLGKPGAGQGSPLRVAPGVCRGSVPGPMMGDTPSGVLP